jgi:putative transcriptional regulator
MRHVHGSPSAASPVPARSGFGSPRPLAPGAADALGINYQTVGYLERGEYNPSLGLAFQIAAYFDLPIEAIFSPEPFGPMSTELYRRSA